MKFGRRHCCCCRPKVPRGIPILSRRVLVIVDTDKGPVEIVRKELANRTVHYARIRVGSRVGWALDIEDIGFPLMPTREIIGSYDDGSGMAKYAYVDIPPPVDFDVGLPETEDSAYALAP